MTAQMTEALLKWLSTFKSQNSSQSDLKSWNDVSDGVAMAKVLHRIDSTHFNSGEKHFILNRILFARSFKYFNQKALNYIQFYLNRMGIQNSWRYTFR